MLAEQGAQRAKNPYSYRGGESCGMARKRFSASVVSLHWSMLRRFVSTFHAGDVVLVRPLKSVSNALLSKPLKPGAVTHTKYGEVHHDDIIGQPKRIYAPFRGAHAAKIARTDSKAARFIVTDPTLDEYTSLSRRKAQPIYSLDANAIVQMADIDVSEPTEGAGPAHFLEAGTGNGSLTLSICSVLHAANGRARAEGDSSRRGAVLHLIDRRADHLQMGAWNVRHFRRGKYAGDVDFHVCALPAAWLEQNPGFPLSGVFLDLPDPHTYLAAMAARMALEATLLVFTPSVTQILDCREALEGLDLLLVKTVELPPGNGGGTREWDVNTVLTRETGARVAVCRPKVGARVVGGGFVGVFKRQCVPADSLRADEHTAAEDT